jgi:hypothetical protein
MFIRQVAGLAKFAVYKMGKRTVARGNSLLPS